MRTKVLILGSTGSIGRGTLDVIREQKNRFQVQGLACKDNIAILNEQIDEFKPEYVCVFDERMKGEVKFPRTRLLSGMSGIKKLVGMDSHIVMNAMPGSIGLEPTVESLRQNKILALANKESLVMGGRLVRSILRKSTASLIPVDSEHSALYQVMKAHDPVDLKNLIITASGGPFKDYEKARLKTVKPKEALKHPTWKMGAKITLDSATLMNKGLEVIEARWLFDVDPNRIMVLIHPESIVHGIVELVDNSFIAYLAYPDMRIPISYALNREKRLPVPFGAFDIQKTFKLSFHPPDMERFPSLKIALDALNRGDSAVVAMNAANEVAAAAFMEGRIGFTEIPAIIHETIEHHKATEIIDTIDEILEVHKWAIQFAEETIQKR